MTDTHTDGGPAFATGDHQHGGQSGMSLRDYFAGQALTGLLAGAYRETTKFNLSEVPQEAYDIADEMISQRSIG